MMFCRAIIIQMFKNTKIRRTTRIQKKTSLVCGLTCEKGREQRGPDDGRSLPMPLHHCPRQPACSSQRQKQQTQVDQLIRVHSFIQRTETYYYGEGARVQSSKCTQIFEQKSQAPPTNRKGNQTCQPEQPPTGEDKRRPDRNARHPGKGSVALRAGPIVIRHAAATTFARTKVESLP